MPQLTARQIEIITAIANGQDTTEIATRIGISPTAIRAHIYQAGLKLGARGRAEVVDAAIRVGILPEQPRSRCDEQSTAGVDPAQVPSLQPRQLKLLGMLTDGLTIEQIARRLDASPRQVRSRLGSIRRRLGARTNTQLVHRAHQLGFLAPVQEVRRVVRLVSPSAPRPGALTPKPRSGPADARAIAQQLEATFVRPAGKQDPR
jgi:DNA-binding NarL/FixJ family response regulator